MSVLIDQAMWPWRGDQWAHLASDWTYAELHAFANAMGIRRLAFQGDHYDVATGMREQAIGRGARPVTSRELVGALRSAGLRARRPTRPWVAQDATDGATQAALDRVHEMWPWSRGVAWSVLRRPQEVAFSATFVPGDARRPSEVPSIVANLAFLVERSEGTILDVVLPIA